MHACVREEMATLVIEGQRTNCSWLTTSASAKDRRRWKPAPCRTGRDSLLRILRRPSEPSATSWNPAYLTRTFGSTTPRRLCASRRAYRRSDPSWPKAIAVLVADRPARDRFLSNARAGGSALWIFAPTKDRADRLVGLLADYHYVSMPYYGDDGVEDVHGDVS